VIGNTYSDAGVEQGRHVLADLARHPATARHVATKLARHFIADEPPQPLVDHLARNFEDTGGDLKELAKTLIAAPESWTPERGKIKRPGEWIVAGLRATGAQLDIGPMMQAQATLGEPLWRPPAPRGFLDDNAAWLDGLALRLDQANAFSLRAKLDREPAEIAASALGPLETEETHRAIARAESKQQALVFVLMAPEFQRR
jgi:uncharacterized protein (DUF1800 family)